MNPTSILGGIAPEVAARVVSRREAVAGGSRFAGALALASVPVALGVFAKRAFAQGGLPSEIVEVLNFALTLEYLENEFYATGLAADDNGDLDLGETQPFVRPR